MEYKVEDLALFNEKKHGGTYINGVYMYPWEHQFSTEEKIKFIDENYELNGNKGACTYMLNLINKYLAEKDNLPKDSWGYVKTVSLKAWLKKNDLWNVVNKDYHYGSYYFIKREYCDFGTLTPRPTWSSNVPYYNQEGKIVDLWFHDILDFLYNEEEKYFNEHDSFVLKIKKVEEYYKQYGCFNIEKISLVGCNGIRILDEDWCRTFHEPRISEEEIDEMLKVYEDVDKIMKAKTIEIQNKLGWELIKD